MWVFTQYGFYSIVCGEAPGGADLDTLMVRARRKTHLEMLQKRFPKLAGFDIKCWRDRDYRYRLIVPKPVWVATLAELANEQDYTNFKGRVSKTCGGAYSHALHDVWGTMHNLQESEPATPTRAS